MKPTHVLLITTLLTGFLSARCPAQPAYALDPAFSPTLTGDGYGGSLNLSVQPDGKFVVTGTFQFVSGMPQNNIARFNSDGTVDRSFSPDSEEITRLGIRVVSGGIGGEAPPAFIQGDGGLILPVGFPMRFVRLKADGSLDRGFALASEVDELIATLPDGRLIARPRDSALGQFLPFLPDGTADTSFKPDCSAGYSFLAAQPDGKLLLASALGPDGWLIRRVHADWTCDASFTIGPFTGNVTGQAAITAVVQNDGSIVVGGDFDSVNGRPRAGLARFHKDGSLDDAFDPKLGPPGQAAVSYLGRLPDDRLVVLSVVLAKDPAERLFRLNADGSPDWRFPQGLAAPGDHVSGVQPDGSVFTWRSSGRAGRYVHRRVLSDGNVDENFPEILGLARLASVSSMVTQADGRVLVAGDVGMVNRIPRSKLARLNPDGSLDATFVPPAAAPGHFVGRQRILLQPDGKVIVGEDSRASPIELRVSRLNADGSPDSAFARVTLTDFTLQSMALQSSGDLIVGAVNCDRECGAYLFKVQTSGVATHFAGPFPPGGSIQEIVVDSQDRVLIAGSFFESKGVMRLSPSGAIDSSFNPNLTPNAVQSAACFGVNLDKQGRIYLFGNFIKADGQPRPGLARLHPNGRLDETFVPAFAISPLEIYFPHHQPRFIGEDGRLYFAKDGEILRFNADGSWDREFRVLASVNQLALAHGDLLLAGGFNSVGGEQRYGIARLIPVPVLRSPGRNGDGAFAATSAACPVGSIASRRQRSSSSGTPSPPAQARASRWHSPTPRRRQPRDASIAW